MYLLKFLNKLDTFRITSSEIKYYEPECIFLNKLLREILQCAKSNYSFKNLAKYCNVNLLANLLF